LKFPSAALVAVLAAACNVEPTAEDQCGADLETTPGCPSAAVVVMSDFISSQVALTRLDGTTLCGSFASTSRSEASALSFPFSGDLVTPSSPPGSGRVVLLDRFGTNVISWLEPSTGRVLAQLPVGTGFQSNPQDYFEFSPGKALVSRWGENPLPGSEAFDGGGDLLVLDTLTPAIAGRIELPRPDDFPPRPAGLTPHRDVVLVTLQRAAVDVKSMGEALIAGVDAESESVRFTVPLPGLKNCGRVTPAPGGARGVIACSGYVDRAGNPADISESAVVMLDLSQDVPVELLRFTAAEVTGTALQSEVTFFSETGLLVKTQTGLGADDDNRLLALDLETGVATELARAGGKLGASGQGVVYGGLLCSPGCGDTCLLADAEEGRLMRWSIGAEGLEPLPPVAIRESIGLPPREIGIF
jgi:hypothetical protein